jgi:transcriptional regulator GlxA family with amidase domain
VHEVVVLALPDTIAFDLSTPVEVLGRAPDASGAPGYRVRVAAPQAEVEAGPFRIATDDRLDALDHADTVVLPGRADPEAAVPDDVLQALRAAHDRGARMVSICVGAFTLAATGLLDGRRATTHWAAVELFRRRHPTVRLDPDVLWVDEGRLLTSAGATAGVDLCLHLVERDHGAGAASEAARAAVAPLRRDGGQAQYIPRRLPPETPDEIGGLLAWLAEHSHRDVSLTEIAARAAVSERTLTRRFREYTGQSPARWLSRLRLQQARELLETTDLTVEQVARRVGFPTTSNFRASFRALHGVSPQTYRHTFRTDHTSGPSGALQCSEVQRSGSGSRSMPRTTVRRATVQ